MTDATVLPVDNDARVAIASLLDQTLFVEAGAGTGKTTALVDRIVALICSGVSLRNVAAITFTEKAAAELKDRLRERLERAVSAPGEHTSAARELCAQAIDELDGAAIQTLHSFAQRILAQHPVEAGLPPIFEVRDEIEASLAFDERWEGFLNTLLAESTSPLPIERAIQLGLDVRKLKDVAIALQERWDRLRAAGVLFEGAGVMGVDTTEIIASLEGVVGALRVCPGCEDKLEAHIREVLVPYLDRLREQPDDDGRIAVLTDGTKLPPVGSGRNGIGLAGHWRGPSKEEVHALIAEANDAQARLLARVRMHCIGPILEALRAEVLAYAAERQSNGTLEFQDLLILARDVLATNEDVRSQLGARFSRILVDEFQDTDPVQIEIATLLASRTAAGSWEQMEVEPGRLFFVGDPKQSIYRFRGADIELYQQAAARFGDTAPKLTVNFRSCPAILEWVNDVFEVLFATSIGQVQYIALDPSPTAVDRGTAVRFFGKKYADTGKGRPTARSVRLDEAPDIANTIRAIQRERWTVRDGRVRKGERLARFSDITILLPARTTLSGIERALEDAEIPFRVESQSLLYATQEVRDLTAILGAIDDPTDEVAVVAALRSPAFACSDRVLEAFVRANGRWDYRREPPAELKEDHPVVASLRHLRRLHDQRWFLSPSEMVETVIRECRLFEVAMAHKRPRETWQRLRFVQERGRAFTESGGTTLRQFVAWLRRQAETDARVVESVAPESDDDAVRIMTVHAAKGLEFPIVLLAGLNTRPFQRRPPVIWDSEGRPQVRVGNKDAGFESEGYARAHSHEEDLDRLEKDRLLYVAATRARDHLIVSLHHQDAIPGSVNESQAQRLFAQCERLQMSPWRPPQWGSQQGLPELKAADPSDTTARRDAWRADRSARIAAARRAPIYAATALKHEKDETPDEKPETNDEDAPWRRGRSGTAIGRAVHAVLQTIDLATGGALEATARAQATAEGIAGREREVEALVRSALASASVREAVAGGRYWREVYVAAPVAGSVPGAGVEGFIDLLYQSADHELVVVDYKTDAVRTNAEIDIAMAGYRSQAAAYALALRETLGRPVARCVFVFARPGVAAERIVQDLDVAIAEIPERIRALAESAL